ncbi:MAG: tRNA nucleotidyltransferase [Eubacteriaceae bacterium]|nr:tRNA nucleotidyltransferase [Eubacteriaceae bacterium]
MKEYEDNLALARQIALLTDQAGGKAYFVGGYVRDCLMGSTQTQGEDIDIEVHGITIPQMEGILDKLGERISIGESFGVYALKGHSLDIAMPRSENAVGMGHRDFKICVDPFIGTYKAARRRDFTVNAMMKDVLTGEIIDHFGGNDDLKEGIIRHVNDETFPQDALRVLRAAQFAARFGFKIAEETLFLCRNMNLSALSCQRVEGELKKALLKADKPSIFFEALREMDRLGEWFGELEALIGIEQNPLHHAEGDVWVHTMMVLDEAAKYRDKAADPFAFMLSAVAHDFGKATATNLKNGQIHSYNHEQQGLAPAESFVKRLTNEGKILEYVLNMVLYHMKPNSLAHDNSSIKSTNKMYDNSIDPMGLIYLSYADSLGKIAPRPYISYMDFLLERLEIYNEYMARPHVTGADLIEAGLKAGSDFSDYLEYAHKLRLAGIEKNNALKQTLTYAQQRRRDNAGSGQD